MVYTVKIKISVWNFLYSITIRSAYPCKIFHINTAIIVLTAKTFSIGARLRLIIYRYLQMSASTTLRLMNGYICVILQQKAAAIYFYMLFYMWRSIKYTLFSELYCFPTPRFLRRTFPLPRLYKTAPNPKYVQDISWRQLGLWNLNVFRTFWYQSCRILGGLHGNIFWPMD